MYVGLGQMIDTPILRFADGSERTIYTAEYVGVRLREAAETLRLMPIGTRDRPGGYLSNMPEPVRNFWEIMNSLDAADRRLLQEQLNKPRSRPSARRISRMWEAVEWVFLIRLVRNRNCVWAVASGGSFRKVSRIDGRSRSQIKNVWDQACDEIACYLNAELLASVSPNLAVLYRPDRRSEYG